LITGSGAVLAIRLIPSLAAQRSLDALQDQVKYYCHYLFILLLIKQTK